ncbi:sensor histidine kinase [Methylobacterium frigidaeris]|uniref:histidine kinase n=2 Tax=Methylobacterium frigidaeris TaxID=2038277 RepID=A0AA37M8P6_9HYPH|nr:sensor histidine kinase [Methylobacterium frigidaeris]GJD66414.1 Adaptive-response sensory-kinase SasA [Methylobacterium frigidaeris]
MISRSSSLFSRLVAVLALVLAVGAGLLLVAAWASARLAADEAYDRLLVGAALQIAETIASDGRTISVDPPFSAFETLALSPRDRIFYKVVDPADRLLTGDADLGIPVDRARLAAGPLLLDGEHRGQAVRAVVTGRYVPDATQAGFAAVVVAQTREARTQLTRALTVKASVMVLAMSALALGAVAVAVRAALRPLGAIEGVLAARGPNDLQPLGLAAPQEIHLLVASIDHFMGRLSGHVAVMKRFIADAAHQIRTPLTALVAQLDLLSNETDEGRRRDQLARIRARMAELGHLTNQLLNHAMVIHRARSAAFDPVDVAGLARRTLIDAVPQAGDRAIDIGYEGPDEALTIPGDAIALREALANLIHNALKHGARGRLTVRVGRERGRVVVAVEDDGPGIPASEWARVREPFQAATGGTVGSGLGLSIAAEVAAAHGGEMRFEVHSGKGFCVILSLPDGEGRP